MTMAGGGVEAMISGLANEMIKDNEVEILTIFEPLETDVFLKKLDPRIKVSSLGKRGPGISPKYIFKMAEFVRRGNYDVVHIHAFFYYHFLSVVLNHKRTKYYYTIHSDATMENDNWDRKLFKLKQFCFKKNWMRPITISKASQESFYNLYHCNSTLIPNGVKRPLLTYDKVLNAISQFRFTPDTKVFIHAGRISKPKNQVAMCEAFFKLLSEKRDICLLIAGSKQDESIFEKLKPYLDNERIKYLGERNDIPLLLAGADAMLLPSIWEGLPVVLLESLSVGCIPICSPVGGIVNVLKEGYNGILTEGSSAQNIYDAISSYLALTKKDIRNMRENCVNSFGEYDIESTAVRYMEAYKS